MDNVTENEAFIYGVLVGVHLYQSKIVSAHKRKEFLKIGDMLYYLQDGRERLAEIMDEICK